MIWSILTFGKHEGLSLPQVVFRDPDWFFHAYEKGFFKNWLFYEAHEVYRRARSIKVPQINGRKILVEYIIHNSRHPKSSGKFESIRLIADGPGIKHLYVRPVIDFYVPRLHARYDKSGYKNFVSGLKAILFGNGSKRMNRRTCEEFFSNDDNFKL